MGKLVGWLYRARARDTQISGLGCGLKGEVAQVQGKELCFVPVESEVSENFRLVAGGVEVVWLSGVIKM